MSSFKNLCRFNAASAGSGSFVVASHVAGCKTPAEAFAKDATTYRYHAQNADGSVWEDGEGVYSVGSVTLTRATIFDTSNNTLTAIVFASPPEVDVFPSPPPALEQIVFVPAGTPMLFQQTAAPVGWTKQTTHNDKALRVVSGAASSGGSATFSSVFTQTQVGSHALTIAEMPSHHHVLDTANGSGSFITASYITPTGLAASTADTSTVGGDVPHTHSISLTVQYVDLIIATKDAFPT